MADSLEHRNRAVLESVLWLLLPMLGVVPVLGMDLSAEARSELSHTLNSLVQLNRRAEKLLQLSRAESGAWLGSETVNLAQLAGIVLRNLIENAVRHGGDGTIDMAVTAPGGPDAKLPSKRPPPRLRSHHRASTGNQRHP